MKRTPIKRKTRLSPISARRKRELQEYSRLRKEFLAERPICEVWLRENGFDSYVAEVGDLPHYLRDGCAYPAEHLLAIGAPASTDCHHSKKRGKHYLDVSSWMAVSREAHQRIHDNPKWAREQGYLA